MELKVALEAVVGTGSGRSMGEGTRSIGTEDVGLPEWKVQLGEDWEIGLGK